MSSVKKGDRIRVTYEGVVIGGPTSAGPTRTFVHVDTGKNTHLAYLDMEGYTVEVLEPEYKPGQIYVDNDGRYFYRVFDLDWPWRDVPHNDRYAHSYPERPLTRLVPEK